MVTYEDLEQKVNDLEALLRDKYNFIIQPGSILEQSCLEVGADLERRRDPVKSVNLAMDYRKINREVAGLSIMIERIFRAEARGGIPPTIIRHLKLLNDGAVSQAMTYNDLSSTRMSPTQKQASDKIFELIIGLAADEVGEELEMDHPTKSSAGANPDVLVTIDGVRWGFACKVPNPQQAVTSKRMRAVLSLVEDGMRQIRNSQAERGYVILNIRNLFDHDMLNPVEPYVQGMKERLIKAFDQESIDQIVFKWFEEFGKSFRHETGTDKSSPSMCDVKVGYSFLCYVESAPLVATPEGFVPTPHIFSVPVRLGPVLHILPSAVQKLVSALAGPECERLSYDNLNFDSISMSRVDCAVRRRW